MTPDNGNGRDFAGDFERILDEGFIHDLETTMPLKLIDTYTGLILKRSQITSLLRKREDYRGKLGDAISEVSLPTGPERPPSLRPKFSLLYSFIADYLAYAMFSHRWGQREMTINDVREAERGIYSIHHAPSYFRGTLADDFMVGAKKLQEFCCVAAKCGYRWAWSDTCCIDDQVYGEKSESLNSMFLWYHRSDLTVVYLDDVDDIDPSKRLPAVDGDRWFDDLEIQDPFRLHQSYPLPPETSDPVTLHQCTVEGSPLQLQSMQPDTQVEAVCLQDLLELYFPTIPECMARGKYRKVPVWVTRGWTLQEMLASKRLRFYSKRWTLLEEADDRDTTDAEDSICISSFKHRARLVDHRANPMWSTALENTTEVPAQEIAKFEAGSRDVRTRLRWAARRSTTKVEDMAYCLLGIFDVTLAVMYGEGPRAFFRLQEELMKRTADVSLFDWCGRCSSVNTFLAYEPESFVEPDPPYPHFEDSSDSIFWMIVDLFCAITGTAWSGVKAAASEIIDWIKNAEKSTPHGHFLVNGEINISLFEHRVWCCELVKGPTAEDPDYHYKLQVNGLKDTNVTLKAPASDLVNNPKQYFLCRVWGRHTHNVFQILLELIEYILKDTGKEILSNIGDSLHLDSGRRPEVNDDGDQANSKLRQEMQMKRKKVLGFFQHPFPVFLVRVEDGRRARLSTVHRVVSDYTKFDFAMPVVTRLVL